MFSVVVYSQHYHNTFIFVIQKQQLKNKYFQLITATNASKRYCKCRGAFDRSNPPEVFLKEGVLKLCSKFTGEHPCRSVI